MPQVSLDDQLYQQVRNRAESAGFASVDEFVTDLLIQEVHSDPFDPETFFTPERMRQIDESIAEVKSGNFYTQEEVDRSLDNLKQEWLQKKRAGK